MFKRFTYTVSLCLALLCHFVSNAQPRPLAENTSNAAAFQALSQLDKSVMQTKTLYDYAAPLSGLVNYTGNSDSPSSNSDHFHQAVWELWMGSFNMSNQRWLNPYDLADKAAVDNSQFVHPVGVMCHNFEYIDSSAVRDNRLYIQDSKLYDVPGRQSSPYVLARAVISTPVFKPEQQIQEGTHYFDLKPDYLLGSMSGQISEIKVNFNDGQGWRVASSPLNSTTRWAVYLPGGETIMQTIITLTNNQTFSASAKIFVKSRPPIQLSGCSGVDQFEVTGFPFSSLEYDGNGSARAARGKAYIFFSNANCQSRQVTKPIVFIDGFDPTNTRFVENIYAQFINAPFDEGGSQKRLADELRAQGYDIIIYDYLADSGPTSGGSDFIEANALSVAKLMQELYSRYGSTMQEDFVLIGPSMGSLVAQYALAWMEKQGMPHHTRLFASFDGVHQGANVPLERVWELIELESRANFVVAKLQSYDQTVEATASAVR
ncbi:esterase/lipase family protein [Spirosoma luteolum]